MARKNRVTCRFPPRDSGKRVLDVHVELLLLDEGAPVVEDEHAPPHLAEPSAAVKRRVLMRCGRLQNTTYLPDTPINRRNSVQL